MFLITVFISLPLNLQCQLNSTYFKWLIWRHVIYTQLFISNAKFVKIPLSFAKHWNVSETHKNLLYNAFLYVYIYRNALYNKFLCVSETHTHTHTHTYIYIYIYLCVCVCVCVCARARFWNRSPVEKEIVCTRPAQTNLCSEGKEYFNQVTAGRAWR